MESPQYKEILTSLQDIVHRAYALGRSDALKRVIEVMQADDTPLRPLALMPPDGTDQPAQPGAPHQGAAKDAAETVPQDAAAPWWSRPPRGGSVFPTQEASLTTH